VVGIQASGLVPLTRWPLPIVLKDGRPPRRASTSACGHDEAAGGSPMSGVVGTQREQIFVRDADRADGGDDLWASADPGRCCLRSGNGQERLPASPVKTGADGAPRPTRLTFQVLSDDGVTLSCQAFCWR